MTTPLRTRVGQLVRLLSSDQVGEAGAAAQALHRAIVGAGRDIHWLADVVEAALQGPDRTETDGDGWLDVDALTLHRHEKPGSRPTVRIEYRCGPSVFRDWWALEHDGFAREVAINKWRSLGGDLPAPRAVDEALGREDELCADLEIAVRHDGHYWQVVGQRLRRGVAACAAATP